MIKVVCYCNSGSIFTSNILLNEIIHNLGHKLQVVAVVETGKKINDDSFVNRLKRFISLIKNLKSIKLKELYIMSRSLEQIANSRGSEYHIPEGFNINSKEHLLYIDKLKAIHNNLHAVALGCPQILKRELLEKFKSTINYHDSYLPAYRGLNATAWSRFEDQKLSGYTFHFVDENIDTGGIIIQELLDYDKNWNIHQHIFNKTRRAKSRLKFLFDEKVNCGQRLEYKSEKSYYSSKLKEATIEKIELTQDADLKIKFKKAFG